MRIGLVDVDGHNFPNLALMKISAFWKMHNCDVEWANSLEFYDEVYMAKVFTGTTAIVYAESAGKAKAEIANDYDIAFTEVKVYRLPWADDYDDAENIPPEVYFEHGWSLWCHRCGNEVCEDEAVIDGEAVYHKWCYERMNGK